MFKRAIVGGVMAGAMVAGGCSAPSSPEVNFPDTGASTAPAPGATAPELQLPQLPDRLPKAIADVANRAVSIQVGAIVNQGSGVRYDNNIVITAGHVVSNEKTHKPYPNLAKNCENLQASTQGGKYGLGAAHDKVTSNYTDSTDIAAFSLSKLINSAPKVDGPLEVAATPPKPGDTLYFVNYEPTENDEMRSPQADTPDFRKPAIYGGVVIKHTDLGDPSQTVDVLTYKSYGAKPDSVSRPGASGGPVFEVQNGKAVYVGEVTRAERENYAATPSEAAEFIGQTPVGAPKDAKLGLSGVQIVTPATIDSLKHGLQAAQPCKIPDF